MLDCIVLTLIVLGTAGFLGAGMRLIVFKDLLISLLVKGLLSLAITTSLTMVVLFFTQSTILSIFVYVIVGLDVIGMLMSLASVYGFGWIETFKLNRMTINHLTGLLYSRLVLGQFSLQAFLGACAYIAVGLIGTCKLFGKRELDF